MTSSKKWLLFLVVFILIHQFTFCQTRTLTLNNGNWNSPASWTPEGIPGINEDVIIPTGLNGNFNVAVSNIRQLTIQTGATLTITTVGRIELNTGDFINNGTILNSTQLSVWFTSPSSLQNFTLSSPLDIATLQIGKNNFIRTTVFGELNILNQLNLFTGILEIKGTLTLRNNAPINGTFSAGTMIELDDTPGNTTNGLLSIESNVVAALARTYPIGSGLAYSPLTITNIAGTPVPIAKLTIKPFVYGTCSPTIHTRRTIYMNLQNVPTVSGFGFTFSLPNSEVCNSSGGTLYRGITNVTVGANSNLVANPATYEVTGHLGSISGEWKYAFSATPSLTEVRRGGLKRTAVCAGDNITLLGSNLTSVDALVFNTDTLVSGFTVLNDNSIQVPVPLSFTTGFIKAITAGIASAPINLIISTPSIITIAGPPNSCPSSSNNFLITPTTLGSTYTWSIPGDWTITTGQLLPSMTAITGTIAGPVSCLETDSIGCVGLSTSISSTIINPAGGSISTTSTICQGQNLNLINIATGTAPFTFVWRFNGIPIATTQNHVIPAAIPTNSGNYTIDIANACGSFTTPIRVVTVTPSPIATTIPPITACISYTTPIPLTGFPAGNNYSWTSLGSGTTSGFSGGSSSLAVPTALNAGPSGGVVTYSVTPINSGCSGIPISVTVSLSPAPAPPTLPLYSVCGNQSATLLANSVLLGNFKWYDAPTGGTLLRTSPAGVNSDTYNTPNLIATSSFYAEFTAINGCVSTRTSTTVSISPPPLASITRTGPASVCNGQSSQITIALSNVTLPAYINVSDIGDLTLIALSTNINVTPGSFGINPYFLQPHSILGFTDANGCVGTGDFSTPAEIEVETAPIMTVSGVTSYCSPGNLSIGLENASTFTWTSTVQSGTVTGNTPSSSSVTINDVLTGIGSVLYSVTPFSLAGCSGTPSPVVVSLVSGANGLVPVILSNDTICPGNDLTILLTNTQPGVQYSVVKNYTTPIGSVIIGDGLGKSLLLAGSAFNPAQNIITVEAILSGCANITLADTSTVFKSTLTPPTIISSAPTLCSSANVFISVPNLYTKYDWYYNKIGPVRNGSKQLINSKTNNEQIVLPGYYMVEITDNFSCNITSDAKFINFGSSLPTIQESNNSGFNTTLSCPLSSPSYQWYVVNSSGKLKRINGANGPSFSAYFNGRYFVVVPNSNCAMYSEAYQVNGLSGGDVFKQGFIENEDEIIVPEFSSTKLGLSPNPSTGNCQLTYLSESFSPIKIKVINPFGMIVFETTQSSTGILELSLELTHISSGLYTIHLEQEGKHTKSKLLLVN